jgi:hypothetical protein
MQSMLAPHQQRTEQRMMAQPLVLCVQDGTTLNYTALARCEGLGPLGSNQTGARSRGLHLHTTMALTAEGLPLGVLQAQCEAASDRADDDQRPSSAIPIEEKKTFAWIQSLHRCEQAAAAMPGTPIVCIADREADFFEFFDEQRKRDKVDLLVRAKHDRLTDGKASLFDKVRSSSVQARLAMAVPRQSTRPKKSKQQARQGHRERTAQVELRYCQVELAAPKHHAGKSPIKLWMVHAREPHAPANVEPLEWFLLTTREITCVDQAQQCLRWYCLRWRIEDWHRVLKSGCRVEALQHKTATRLERAIALNIVIAWRIMLLTLLGRQSPELPAEVLFSDLEVRVLQAYAKKTPSNARTHCCSATACAS